MVGATQLFTSKIYQQCWKEWAGCCAQQGLPISALSATKLANFCYICFRLAWPGIQLVYIVLLFLLFLEPHWLHKASNHPVISKIMCHFYLQHPPVHKQFDTWDV